MNLLYLKIAFRYLYKNKLYSFINIIGLSLGIAAFIIISLYVSYEKSYDTFEGSNQVYRVYMDYLKGREFEVGDAQTYNLTGPTLEKEFPEIIENVRLYRLEKVTFVNKDKVIQQPSGALADASYFDIFNSPLLKGSINDFEKPNTIILSESLSRKIFGEENPILKTISIFYGSGALLEVVGIMPDVSETTHMKLNFLVSFETMKTWDAMKGQEKLNWNMNNFFTYLKVNKNTDFEELQQKIINTDIENDPDERHNIELLTDIHLHSDKPYEAEANGSISRIRFLSVIAIIILILSWLNYINLSTAKSLERSKEIGIRKVAGAQRSQLMLQSLVESLLLNIIAIIFALVILFLLLPIFNDFVGKSLSIKLIDLKSLLPFLSIIIIGTVLSGIYPAFVLSSFSPVKSLKGKISSSSKGISLRKGLITLQFFATVVLIIGTLVVVKQINFLKEQPIGVNLQQVIALNGNMFSKKADSLLAKDAINLGEELKKFPFISSIATAQTYPGDGYENLSSSVGITYPNGITDDKTVYYTYPVHSNYFELMDIEFVAGEKFIPTASGFSNKIVINEVFARDMGISKMEDAIGKTIKFWGQDWVISGVMKNYHHFGLKNAIKPMVIRQGDAYNNLLVKLNQNTASTSGFSNAIAKIKEKWTKIFPQSTFNYTFLDKKFEAQYSEDHKFSIAFQIFTALAILIAALGLFGLTSYMCLQRRKEIGIRKVTGATLFQILKLLNKDFIMLVVLAFIIAVPVGWYIMKKWLQEFAYRTDLNWWIFALSAVIAVFIALITVSVQSIKAATVNPVKSLRTE